MKAEKVKVSVVVPIFGVELYIEKCVRSLFSQTLNEIEFIFVDDCTTDSSMDILKRVLDEYPHRKHQVKILHHDTNKGLPFARQTGLKQATGEYVAHCDSDDWVSVDMYEKMYQNAIENDSDIVFCDYFMVIGRKQKMCRTFCAGIDKAQMFKKIFSQQMPWNVWSKLVRRDLYDNPEIIFPTGTQGEDMALFLQLFYFSRKCSYLPDPLYYYVYNAATLIHSVSEESVMRRYRQSFGNVDLLVRFFSSHRLFSNATDNLTYLKTTPREMLMPLMKERKYYELWKNTYPEINSLILKDPEIRFHHKIKFILVYTRLLRK